MFNEVLCICCAAHSPALEAKRVRRGLNIGVQMRTAQLSGDIDCDNQRVVQLFRLSRAAIITLNNSGMVSFAARVAIDVATNTETGN